MFLDEIFVAVIETMEEVYQKNADDAHNHVNAVSYTHLKLPTSDLVEISVVAVSLKKKKHQIVMLARQKINK